MQIRHYTWVIWHSLGFILLCACIAAGATYAISKFVITPVYQASALVQVNAAGDSSTVYADEAQAEAYALLVATNPILQAVADRLPGTTVAQLKTAVSASPVASTSIIEIRAQASDPQQAANIANTVAQSFIALQKAKVTNALQYSLQQTSQSMDSAGSDLANAQARLTTLQKSHASATVIAQQMSIVNSDQLNYDSLLANYQQIQQRLLQVNNILIQVQSASAPAGPLSPRTSLNTLVAGALGALLVIVFTLVRDWADNSIRTAEDVAHLTLLEPLGSVPRSKQSLSSALALESNSDTEQAFLVMAMSVSKQRQKRAAVLLTSLRPGAGTTTVAASLAIALAHLGKRVMLVDVNLRRPSLASLFQRPNSQGLFDSLSDLSILREGNVFAWLDQWSTEIPNLWLLPAGQPPASPGAQLRSSEMDQLVRRLLGSDQVSHANGKGAEDLLDYIIFDAPSLKESVDPVALTPVIDYTVLVAQAGKEHGAALNKAGAVFQRLGAPVVGVIVNRQTARHRPYFYIESLWQNTPVLAESLPTKSALLAGQSREPAIGQAQGTEEEVSADRPAFPNASSMPVFHAMEEISSVLPSLSPSTPLPPRPAQNRVGELGDDNHQVGTVCGEVQESDAN